TLRRNRMSTRGAIKEKELLFFKQSCILGLLYFSCVMIFNGMPYFFTSKWLLFISSTITWILTQSLDG
ncbi:unnamed protein product, partial [Onchocerca ochengi]